MVQAMTLVSFDLGDGTDMVRRFKLRRFNSLQLLKKVVHNSTRPRRFQSRLAWTFQPCRKLLRRLWLVSHGSEQISEGSSPRALSSPMEDARGIAGGERLLRTLKNRRIDTDQEVRDEQQKA